MSVASTGIQLNSSVRFHTDRPKGHLIRSGIMVRANKRVFASVSIELANMFWVLQVYYSRAINAADLADLAKLEAFLKAKLVEYDPETAKELNEELFVNSL